jgi:UMP-CMP kinase
MMKSGGRLELLVVFIYFIAPLFFSNSVQFAGSFSTMKNLSWNLRRGFLDRVLPFRRTYSYQTSSFAGNFEAGTRIKPSEKPKIVFILGGPGAGKGTQCELLAKEFGIAHLSAGELLRKEQHSGSENGKLIDSFLKEGRIVPVTVSLSLLKREILNRKEHRFLIDGFPRNQDNLKGWMETMPESCDLELVVAINCEEKEFEKRILQRGLTSKRDDDNLQTLRKRIDIFERESLPVIRWFQDKAAAARPDGGFLFLSIDGDRSKEEVFQQLKNGFLPILAREIKSLDEKLWSFMREGDRQSYENYCCQEDNQNNNNNNDSSSSHSISSSCFEKELILFRRVACSKGALDLSKWSVRINGREAVSSCCLSLEELGNNSSLPLSSSVSSSPVVITVERNWRYLNGNWKLIRSSFSSFPPSSASLSSGLGLSCSPSSSSSSSSCSVQDSVR